MVGSRLLRTINLVKPSSHGKDDDDSGTSSSAATALIVVACLASAAVGLALLYVFWTKRPGRLPEPADGLSRRCPGRRRRSTARSAATAWSQPETPGVSNAPPSFEDHVANPMRGGYEAPGIEDPLRRSGVIPLPLPPV